MSDDNPYKYDVFISYRWIEPDKSWVRDQLEPALTNAGLEVFLDVHDFVRGSDLILEMTRAGRESKRCICVLSPDYVNDPDRMVNFESLMLRRKDPSGINSRLIPFILRPTELPDHLANLIAVDWTNPTDHAREWIRLLDVLEAKYPEAPPPAALIIDPDKPQPPSPPRPTPTRRPRIPKPMLLSILAVLLLVAMIAIVHKSCSKPPVPDLITLTGHVYYQQAPGNLGLIPVSGVAVSLSQDSNIRSSRTSPDGKFVLEGVPANASKDLKFEYGEVLYPMAYQANGSYPVIPLDIDPARKFIDTPWVDENKQPCVPFDGRSAKYSKVFKKDLEFQAESGKNDALLTVQIVGAPEMIVLAADVVATPGDSFRNETPLEKPNEEISEEDRKRSHTFKFTLSKTAPRPQLIVCLGSDKSPAEISSNKLFTYYTLP